MTLCRTQYRVPQAFVGQGCRFVSARDFSVADSTAGWLYADPTTAQRFSAGSSGKGLTLLRDTEQVDETLIKDEGTRFAGQDPDNHAADLYNTIEAGDFPSWNLYI